MSSLSLGLRAFAVLIAGALPLAAQARKPTPLPELEARAQRDSLDATAQYELSLGYYRANRLDDEERALRRAIAIDPRYAPAYLSLSYLPFERRSKLWKEVRKGNVPPEWRAPVEESRRLVSRAFLIDPLVDLRVLGADPPKDEMMTIPEYGSFTTAVLLYLGVGAFGAGRYERSFGALQLWVERAYAGKPRDSLPDFLFWYRGLAAAHLRVNRVAIEDFETLLGRAQSRELSDTLIQIPLNTNDYRYVLAVLHEASGKPADAVRLYQETLAADLGHYMAHVRLAQLYRRFKMWNDAVTEAQRAVETNPDDPTALLELGVILAEAGRTTEAEETLLRAHTANPRDVRSLYHLGLTQAQAAKKNEARANLERFVTVAPSRYESLVSDAKQRLAGMGGQ
jgi:tetratricopeptide (TPR) repeat protein